jgi:hypothetical protein
MLRIGCGAGFSADRLQPAIDLARDGNLDFLVFECIGERTMAFGHRDRRADPGRGYTPQLAQRMRGVLRPCWDNDTRIVTNMGVANPRAAGEVTIAIARELGLSGLKVAVVTGDDVAHAIGPATPVLERPGVTVGALGRTLVGANAYLGIEGLLPALGAGADVVIAGRIADPSLFLAPIVHCHGWAGDDWSRLGQGTLVGHLLECGMQVTGGYFADPGRKDVPRLAGCGFPIAEVEPDGTATITKLASAGGMVTVATVKEQLLYEVHDPASYLTPDVTADFSTVAIAATGPDRVRVSGASGRRRPDRLKVTVGFDGGFMGEGGISYAGPGAGRRAELARDILVERLQREGPSFAHLRIDLIGIDSLHATAHAGRARNVDDARDVRLTAAVRSDRRDDVEAMLWEVEALLCSGPAGGGGYRGQITASVTTCSTLIDRDLVRPSFEMLVA